MTSLKDVWAAQKAYNDAIRLKEPGNFDHWMKNYLLGAISEVDEILNEINWKAHRKGRVMNPHNLARELADLTKYVFSMWEWSGFSEQDMLDYAAEKSAELTAQLRQDFEQEIPPNVPVIISDIDGTLGDWRKAFLDWVRANHLQDLPSYDDTKHLSLEVSMGLSYPIYAKLKEQFEAEGGYQLLEAYSDAVYTLNTLAYYNQAHIILYTARPARVHTRIWSDTWHWLEEQDMGNLVKELRIGYEDRIARACEIRSQGHPLVLLEDDPTLALRAAATGIRVVMREQGYNVGVHHRNILGVGEFSPATITAWLKESETDL